MVSIPKYKVIKKLGEGRNSISYLAEHRVLGRQLVLKVSSAAAVAHENNGFGHLYLKKARAYASLKHPNIVHVHDIGLTNNSLFFVVTDYLNHGNLHDRLGLQDIGLDQAIQIISDIGSALDYAHSTGITHCDLTPNNIVFSEEEKVLLTGFSVVKTKKWNTHCDAPENSNLDEGQQRIKFDVYRLSAIFYEMITGKEILYEGIFDTPPSVQSEYIYLQETIDKALSSQPEEWFGSAGDFVQSILKAVDSVKQPAIDTVNSAQGRGVNNTKTTDEALVNPAGEGELFIEPSSYVLGEPNPTVRMATWGLAGLGSLVLASGLYLNGAFDQEESRGFEADPMSAVALENTLQGDIEIDEIQVNTEAESHSNILQKTPKNLEKELEELYSSLSTYSKTVVSNPPLVTNITHDVSKPLVVIDTPLNHEDSTAPTVDSAAAVKNVKKDILLGRLVVAAIDGKTQKPLQARFFIIPEKGPMRISKAGEQVNLALAPGQYTLLAEYDNEQSDLYGISISAGSKVKETLVIDSHVNKQDKDMVVKNELRDSLVEGIDEAGILREESVVDSEEVEAPRALPEVGINLDNKYL